MISWIENEIVALIDEEEDLVVVNLIAVYDKSEQATISEAKLLELIANLEI